MQNAVTAVTVEYRVIGEVTILKEFKGYDSECPTAGKNRLLRHGIYILLSKKMCNGRGTWWVVISDGFEVGFPPDTWRYNHDAQLCYLHENQVGAVVIPPSAVTRQAVFAQA